MEVARVFPEGDCWYVMQQCVERLAGRECSSWRLPKSGRPADEVGKWCDCVESEGGTWWMQRGPMFMDEAAARAKALEVCERVLVDLARSRERAVRVLEVRRAAGAPLVLRSPLPQAFGVLPELCGFRVARVCADVLAFGECRFALHCECVHSDVGPLRDRLQSFAVERDASSAARLHQEDFERAPARRLAAWLVSVPAEVPVGCQHVSEAMAKAFASIDPGEVP